MLNRSQISTTLAGLLAAAVTATLESPAAEACSWGYCGAPAYVIPADEPGTEIPANAPLVWTPLRLPSDLESAIEALVLEDGAGNPVPIELSAIDLPRFHNHAQPYLIEPTELLEPGVEYTLRTPNTECPDWETEEPIVSAFTAAPPADSPGALGTLNATTPARTELEVALDASCSAERDVVAAEVILDLAPAAAPWRDALAYETLVDGVPWRPSDFSGAGFPVGSSWIGRAQDLVFALCDDLAYAEHSFLLPGTYSVAMRARIPGTELVLETDPVAVDLSCDAAPESPTEEGESAQPEEAEEIEPASDSGGCSTAGGPSPGLGLLVLLGLLGRIRRRSSAPIRLDLA